MMEIRERILRAVAAALAAAAIAIAAPGAVSAQHEEHDHAHGTSDANLGEVRFPTSCNVAARAEFDRGIALLHSFGYELAREAFTAAAERDPSCGIAWWGVAMTWYHPLWAAPTPKELEAGTAAAEKATAAGAGTDRERAYIEAIATFYRDAASTDHATRAKAYTAKLEQIAKQFPDDPEARIFHALALLGTASAKDTSLAQQRRAGEILNAELAAQPRHPGIVHYIIHSFDYPGLADLALPAARAYAEIAPASPHAQHMPSHIFTRLGLWQESIRSNLDSEASANAIVAKKHPGAASMDALHALDYLEYAYLQTGRIEKAREVVDRVARATTFDDPNFVGGYTLAAVPARYALERRAWKEAAALQPPGVSLPWERFPYALASTHFARAIGAARSGDATTARTAVGELGRLQQQLAASPPPGPYDWAGQVESMRLAAAGWLAQAEGKSEEALALLRQGAELQERVGKHPVTPGELLPARELLADLLAEIGRPREALAEYEASLTVQPGRLNSLEGAVRAAKAAGDETKAKQFASAVAALRAEPASGG
jgi:tetratricopeptide (TPR) repeat protein